MPKKKLSINKETIKSLKVKSSIKTGGSNLDCIGTDACLTVYPCNPKPTLLCLTLK